MQDSRGCWKSDTANCRRPCKYRLCCTCSGELTSIQYPFQRKADQCKALNCSSTRRKEEKVRSRTRSGGLDLCRFHVGLAQRVTLGVRTRSPKPPPGSRKRNLVPSLLVTYHLQHNLPLTYSPDTATGRILNNGLRSVGQRLPITNGFIALAIKFVASLVCSPMGPI